MNDVLMWNYDMEKCPLNKKVFLLSDDDFPVLPQGIYIGTIIDNGKYKTRGECFMGDPDCFYRSKIIAWCPCNKKTLNRYFVLKMNEIAKYSNTEHAHVSADDVLCDFLRLLNYDDLVDVY